MDDNDPTTLAPQLPRAPGDVVRWGQLYGSAAALALAEAARRLAAPLLVIAPDAAAAQSLEQEVRFYAGDCCPTLAFPDWETLPYDVFSPHQDIISERLATLYRLPTLTRGLLVIPVSTLMQRLPPRQYLEAHSLVLDVGQRLDLEDLRQRLENSGYRCVSQVMEHGEFAVRGSLIDLYPMGAPLPYRIELFDDEVETLRTFDPETQRSADKVTQARLLPAREFPLDEGAINRFRAAYRTRFEGDPQRSLIYREVSQGNAPAGIEYYLPLFFDATATLFDYLPTGTVAVTVEDVHGAAETYWEEIAHRYEQRRHDTQRPLLPPLDMFLPTDQLFGALRAFARVESQRFEQAAGAGRSNLATQHPPPLAIDARATRPAARLQSFLAEFPGRVLFAAETAGRRESLLELLRGIDVTPTLVEDWRAFATGDAHCAITVAPLEQGLVLEHPPIAVVTEAQLFGERVLQRRRRRGRSRDSEQVVRSLAELTEGAPVVHEDHGVGRYLGLQTLDVGGVTTEFLTLEYAGGDKLYVPVSSLHLISRYAGAAPESAPLHKLGSGQWEKAKRRASERVRDVAAELLDIYARRAARQGHAAKLDDGQYAAFAAGFPFEETPDQQAAIDAVLEDMRAPRPMDRLVCGDVGFGKTEVAMRAAFVAVQDGRQVAVLVPTTLLVQQHTQTFRDRFADWPVRVEGLSRFRSKKEQEAVVSAVTDGTVDIVIGTHKLLQEDIRFKRLGLVIIDEEHRFGVRQKERFKSLRAEVDVLTLTATPIPRTLNMALASLRDLSVIATAPARRLAVKTFVHEWNDNLIQEACLREVKRGGQVYFLHNDVETIERQARELEALVPQARVAVAHGQMRERELERVMSDFYHHRYNVLVCTTIIETGIDVPSANTIVINRADRFGLAQLYQLRGRVGRSHHRAYAYLVVPPQKRMTPDAVKRLEAIEAIEELGTGFTLATHDLEIRGAGELLGDEQSGQMHEIGFNLYSELLERAVQALKAGRQPELDRPLDHGAEIDLHLPALIPEDYLPDVHTRLVMYKRIASAKDADELRELQVEMIDRFGLLPDPTRRLFEVTQLKLKATPLGIEKIDVGPQGGRVLFRDEPNVDPVAIINLIQGQPKIYKLDGGNKLRLVAPLPDAEARIRALDDLLQTLGARDAA
ncbi:transcription-repair coupling factor [Ectothiorhodospiraceae bacterium 2226]|nr:transcription-repair coupling factor [Ectothiorhodospiraceae bacterium 2226]